MIVELVVSAIAGGISGFILTKSFLILSNKRQYKEMASKIKDQDRTFVLNGEQVKLTDYEKVETLQKDSNLRVRSELKPTDPSRQVPSDPQLPPLPNLENRALPELPELPQLPEMPKPTSPKKKLPKLRRRIR